MHWLSAIGWYHSVLALLSPMPKFFLFLGLEIVEVTCITYPGSISEKPEYPVEIITLGLSATEPYWIHQLPFEQYKLSIIGQGVLGLETAW